MPPNSPPTTSSSSTTQAKLKQQHQQRVMIERCSTSKKACEQCRRRRRVCNSQRPCAYCIEANQECVYSVVSDHSRSVFSTQAARRLSSGSACETCRRRKTKCDGGNPCNFCATNNIECVNHSERRHSAKQLLNNKQPTEAMDRIEDRLRRIERLMTAFTPSPLSQTSDSHKVIRPHRHSVQGINVSKEQTELGMMKRRGSPYASPRYGSMSPPTSSITSTASSSPVSIMRPSNSHTSIAHSMLNLSISPSNSSTTNQPLPLTSTSSPSSTAWPISPPSSSSGKHEYLLEQQQQHLPSPPNSARSTTSCHDNNNEWKTSGAIPSLMDQLSKRTFATSAVDYTMTHYPIYPLTPPPSQSRQTASPPLPPIPTRPNSHS